MEEVISEIYNDLDMCKEAVEAGITPTNLESIIDVIQEGECDLIMFHMNQYFTKDVYNPNWCNVFDAMCKNLPSRIVTEYFCTLWNEHGKDSPESDWAPHILTVEYIEETFMDMEEDRQMSIDEKEDTKRDVEETWFQDHVMMCIGE